MDSQRWTPSSLLEFHTRTTLTCRSSTRRRFRSSGSDVKSTHGLASEAAVAATSASIPSSAFARNRRRPASRAMVSSGATSTDRERASTFKIRFVSASRPGSPVVDSTRTGVGTTRTPSCSTIHRSQRRAWSESPESAESAPLSSTQRGRAIRAPDELLRRRVTAACAALAAGQRSVRLHDRHRRRRQASEHRAWRRARPGAPAVRALRAARGGRLQKCGNTPFAGDPSHRCDGFRVERCCDSLHPYFILQFLLHRKHVT